MSRRVACLLVPDLPLRAELRAHPELETEPLAIASGPGTRAELISVSPRAFARGVRKGHSLPQARAVAGELVVRIASPALEQAARQTLLDVALSLAPRAELAPRGSGPFAPEGAVFVDASGIEALHETEQRFASVLHARAESAGLPGFVGLAASPNLARLAARPLAHAAASGLAEGGDERTLDVATTRILRAGEERRFLAPLSVDLLEPDDATAEALTRFGIHRIADLLRLSPRALAARLGPPVLELVARARGEEDVRPLPEARDDLLEEGQDLEAPVERLEPLAFVLRGLASRLQARLELRSLGCAGLELQLALESGRRIHRRVGLGAPSRDARVWLRLLRLALESDPPGEAIEGVWLRGRGVPLRRDQLDFFLPRGPAPGALDETLAELGSLCGTDRVGAPALVDGHRPSAFRVAPFAPRLRPAGSTTTRGRISPKQRGGPGREHRKRARGTAPRLTLRALRPPLRAEVRSEGGRPGFLRSAVSQGRVVAASGPWRTTGEWWSDRGRFALDHYDLQMEDGTLLRVGFDWKVRRWQIDGIYD